MLKRNSPDGMVSLRNSSMIIATVIVSESEIKAVHPSFNDKFEHSNPEEFRKIMYSLGMDTSYPIIRQEGLKHRNRLNQVVKCTRWLGEERLDDEWIKSGYASVEAKDKHSGNHILEDLYRQRSLTVDAQERLEQRDRYTTVDESAWE